MSKRVCSEPGCPRLIDAGTRDSRCDEHRRARDKARGSSTARGYGVQHQRTRAALLPEAYGTRCLHCGEYMWPHQDLALDHTEDRSSYRGIVHASCNASEGARRGNAGRRQQEGATMGGRFKAERPRPQTQITLVTGPPCSGKTTYVREHMTPGDLVVDYDALAVALGSPDTHNHPDTLWPYVLQARDAVLDRMTRDARLRRAWIVRCDPTPEDYRRATSVVTLDVTADVCKGRAVAEGRPAKWADLIDQWHARRISPGA